MASHGAHPRPDLSKLARPVSGLGIAVSASLSRQPSHHGLIENAAPMAGHPEPEAPGRDVEPADDRGRDRTSTSPEDEFRHSIHSAWDIGARRGRYAPLEHHELDPGRARDLDARSLDSPQTPDLDLPGDDDPRGREGPTTARDVGADVRVGRRSWPAASLLVLSAYSTVLSGAWLAIAIAEPRWGGAISTRGPVSLSTASLLTTVVAKTIEMSFVAVTVAFVGQVLTRRAVDARGGTTLAELAMRTWITQPGTLFTNPRVLPYAVRTLLGVVALLATITAMFYTTASDTMIRPKLQFSDWRQRHLDSTIYASYANAAYVNNSCNTPISVAMDADAGSSCLAVQYSGDSFSDFMGFLSAWKDTSGASLDMARRPAAQSTLYNNVTMTGTWIETQYSDVSKNFDAYSRIINNVSLAMPHPGVYKAATDRDLNGILQPSDLDGVGSYNVSASVVSPAVNVLCVNMDADELAPLVNATGPADDATAVDDIFRWGDGYDRPRPSFPRYAPDYNTLVDYSTYDAIYVLGKNQKMDNYTLCELRSWPAIQCSTRFNVTSTSMGMSADCAQDVDYYAENATLLTANPDAYVHGMAADGGGIGTASADWVYMVELWALAINLDGGAGADNASHARVLTELALAAPRLGGALPSMAEALAATVANTLVAGAVDTPFVHYWDHHGDGAAATTAAEGVRVRFPARVRAQAYASWHPEPWQGVFHAVLAAAFLLNLVCLAYLCRVGVVRDLLAPASLFALATAGTGTGTPGEGEGDDGRARLLAPWRLAYRPDAGRYCFEAAASASSAAVELEDGVGWTRSHVRFSGKPLS